VVTIFAEGSGIGLHRNLVGHSVLRCLLYTEERSAIAQGRTNGEGLHTGRFSVWRLWRGGATFRTSIGCTGPACEANGSRLVRRCYDVFFPPAILWTRGDRSQVGLILQIMTMV